MTQEIIQENLKTLEIKQICLNKDKFGVLTFDKSYPLLHALRKSIVELEDLGYQNTLTPGEASNIDGYRKRLLEHIKRIHDINPAKDANFNTNVRQQIENEIEGFYNNTIAHLRPYLTYLRQEAALKSQDTNELQEQQKITVQTEQRYKELAEKLEARIQDFDNKAKELAEKKKQVEVGHGQLAAVRLAVHFEAEAQKYKDSASTWLKWGMWGYLFIISFVLFLLLVYLFNIEIIDKFLTWQLGGAKLIAIGALWYGLSFAVKNYNVNSHLFAVNRHRAAVARTLEDFLASDQKLKVDMIKNATDAMFKNMPVGFVSKAESSNGPMHEIINILNPLKSDKYAGV